MWHNLLGLLSKIHLVGSLVGIIFIIGGAILWKKPPARINHLYGYRTRRSMASQQAWDFAQRHSGIEMIRIGIVQLVFSFSGLFIELSTLTETLAGLALMIAMIIIMFVRTETAIKRHVAS